MIETTRTVAALRARIAAWRQAGGAAAIALVPTMGALHRGHLALIAEARAQAQRVVVSIFVNPTQFGPGEDFTAYPRDEAADLRALASAQADLLYAPEPGEIYGEGFATTVTVSGLSAELEGAVRPHHFAGVATVVAKLLNQARPDVAVFGEKDYQQLLIVRRLASDLDIATRIHAVPTLRDPDGLALSSRNAYLTAPERQIAPALYGSLREVAAGIEAGRETPAKLIGQAKRSLLQAGFASIDYLELRDGETLAAVEQVRRPARLLVAARLGKTRLIDNVAVNAPQ